MYAESSDDICPLQLHSPAHLLYAAKNVIDTSLLPPRFLL